MSLYSEPKAENYDRNVSEPQSKRLINDHFRAANAAITKEKLAIVNRHHVGRKILVDPRSIIRMLSASFSPGSSLNTLLNTTADTAIRLPNHQTRWVYQNLKDSVESILVRGSGSLTAMDKLHLVIMLKYAEQFDSQPFEEGKRTTAVLLNATFYGWFIRKMLVQLTGLGPRLIKGRIAHYMKMNPHAREDPNSVTFQMEDAIPFISWLEREGIAINNGVISSLTNHPVMNNANDHDGTWVNPGGIGDDETTDVFFTFDNSMNYNMLLFGDVLERFLRDRYGKRSVIKEGLELWRSLESLVIDNVDIFSPQSSDGTNLNSGVPLGEEGAGDKSYDIKREFSVELAFNYNTAGEDGTNLNNGDRPVIVYDLDLFDAIAGLTINGTWLSPVWIDSYDLAQNVRYMDYYELMNPIPNLNPHDFHTGEAINRGTGIHPTQILFNLDVMIDAIANDMYGIKGQLAGSGGDMMSTKLGERISMVDFINAGLNGGSESPVQRKGLAEFLALENDLKLLYVDATVDNNIDYHTLGNFRYNHFFFEGMFDNGHAQDNAAHDYLQGMLSHYPVALHPNGRASELFWMPMFTARPLLRYDHLNGVDQFYVRKSYIDNYLSKIPKSLDFTILYLLGKEQDIADAELNPDGLGIPGTGVLQSTLLQFPVAASVLGADYDLDITTGDQIDAYAKGHNFYPILTFDTFIDGFNYREVGVGNTSDPQNGGEVTNRYREARTHGGNQPDMYVGAAVDFEDASWSVHLSTNMHQTYLPILDPYADVLNGGIVDNSSLFESRYSWYVRNRLKQLFPGLFAFGKLTNDVNTLMGIHQLLIRPAIHNAASQLPDALESWMTEASSDPWIGKSDIASLILPNIFDPLAEVFNLLG